MLIAERFLRTLVKPIWHAHIKSRYLDYGGTSYPEACISFFRIKA